MMTQGTDPVNNNNQNYGYQPPNNNFNQGYQQTSPQPIIINSQPQTNVIVANDPYKFKTSSVLATCPSCKIASNTNVTTSLSVGNLLCYICCDPLIWLIYQLVRGKDINCCDATHHCPSCGGFIANYQSC
jgi:hypothetical protein